MTVASYRVSDRGQMALPAEARRRWGLTDGGAVEVADLGDALVIVPAGRGGLRGLVGAAIDEAGGYASLSAQAASEAPDLAGADRKRGGEGTGGGVGVGCGGRRSPK